MQSHEKWQSSLSHRYPMHNSRAVRRGQACNFQEAPALPGPGSVSKDRTFLSDSIWVRLNSHIHQNSVAQDSVPQANGAKEW